MSKRDHVRRTKSFAVTKAKPASASADITKKPGAPNATSSSRPWQPGGGDSGGKGRWLIFGAVVLVLVVGWGLYAADESGVWPFIENSDGPGWVLGGDPWKAEAWDPVTDEDKLIDRFAGLHRKGDAAAAAQLAKLPADDGPMSEAEFERRAAGYFLRDPELKVVEIWKGEVGEDGKPRPSAGRYTLVTKGSARTPHLKVRDDKGKESATALSMFNPDIVVEVRGGKIHPLRTEAHRAP